LFGEKYGENVRVLSMGAFSIELCGGTHVNRTGDIGTFKIVSEGGIAAGIRRIEAVTGNHAVTKNFASDHILLNLSNLLRTGPEDLEDKIGQLIEKTKEQDREIRKLREDVAGSTNSDLENCAVCVRGVNLVSEKIDGASVETLRKLCDDLKNKLGDAVVVLGAVDNGKVRLIAGVTKGLSVSVNAGEIVNFVAQQVGGRGGGRPDMAQAGGTDPSRLDVALASVGEWLAKNVPEEK
jgi:alanyl-tRNA synthetase